MRLEFDLLRQLGQQAVTLLEQTCDAQHLVPIATTLLRSQLKTKCRNMSPGNLLQALQCIHRIIETPCIKKHLGFQHQARRLQLRIVIAGKIKPGFLLVGLSQALRRTCRNQCGQTRRLTRRMRLASLLQSLAIATFEEQAHGVMKNTRRLVTATTLTEFTHPVWQ